MDWLRTLSTFALLLCSLGLMAQNTMRIHYNDGTEQDIPLAQIDSITFLDKEEPEETATLTGSWLWGNTEAGYYELLTFREDRTYTGYDNYFSFGYDTTTYGWYSSYGNMLTLQSNGFGYQRMYNWFLLGLTTNALEVMTRTGAYTYYRLQPEVISVSSSAFYAGFSADDAIVFADGVTARVTDGRLQGIIPGTTYILLRQASTGRIVAYKVVVK